MTENENLATDVLIIGSGPAGGGAALALATYGVDHMVITKYRWTANTRAASVWVMPPRTAATTWVRRSNNASGDNVRASCVFIPVGYERCRSFPARGNNNPELLFLWTAHLNPLVNGTRFLPATVQMACGSFVAEANS